MTAALAAQVGVDLVGFAEQIRHVLLGVGDDFGDRAEVGLQLVGEASLLLVSPGLFERVHLRGQCHALGPQLLGEPVQRSGELAKLFRINVGLGHGADGWGEGAVGGVAAGGVAAGGVLVGGVAVC